MKITAVTDINPEPLVIPKIYFFWYFASCIRIVFGRRKNENMSKNLKKLLQLYTEISYSSTLTPLQFSCTLIPFLQLIWMILCLELWESMSFNHSSGKLSSLLFKKTFHNFTLKINLTLQNYFERPTAPNHNLINELMTFT